MTSIRVPLLLTLSIACANASASGSGDYRVTVQRDLDRIHVHACFVGKAPRRLEAGVDNAGRYLLSARRSDTAERLARDDDGIRTAALPDDVCLNYVIDAARAARAGAGRGNRYAGPDLLIEAGQMLFRPVPPAGTGLTLTFDLPDDIDVSAPWHMLPPVDGKRRFRIGQTPAYWPARVAFGRFETRDISVPGAELRLAVLGAKPGARADDMADWLRGAATAVSMLYGQFPLREAQILVVPLGARDEAVPWAQVLRGGGAAAHFFVDPTRPLAEFDADWTAAHELSHMLLPYLGSDGAWLSEGFASYFQNVLRARAGLHSEADAWQKLHDGFQRGIAGTRGLPLDEATKNMRRDRAFMRVYWSGAAVALKADIKLAQSDARQSLAAALAGLKDCCLPATRRWRARELIRELDRLTDSEVFGTLYAAHAQSPRFPSLEREYAWLGLSIVDGRVELDKATAPTARRRAIMQPQKVAASALAQ